jgi:hypothetical protein
MALPVLCRSFDYFSSSEISLNSTLFILALCCGLSCAAEIKRYYKGSDARCLDPKFRFLNHEH